MNCNKCFEPMKEYVGLNERDWYCNNKNCGKEEDKEKTEKIFIWKDVTIDNSLVDRLRKEWADATKNTEPFKVPKFDDYDTHAAVKSLMDALEREMFGIQDDTLDALNYMFGPKGDKNERK